MIFTEVTPIISNTVELSYKPRIKDRVIGLFNQLNLKATFAV